MPSVAFRELIERAITDDVFAERLKNEQEAALAGYDITEEERAALLSGDAEQQAAVGLDQRISKGYSSGYGSSSQYGYGRRGRYY